MEQLLQYLDDLDDLLGMAGLIMEKLRAIAISALSCLCLAAIAAGASWFAYQHPPIALAISVLLFVTLLYRAVVMPQRIWSPSA